MSPKALSPASNNNHTTEVEVNTSTVNTCVTSTPPPITSTVSTALAEVKEVEEEDSNTNNGEDELATNSNVFIVEKKEIGSPDFKRMFNPEASFTGNIVIPKDKIIDRVSDIKIISALGAWPL